MNGVLNVGAIIHLLKYRLDDPWWSGVFMGLGTADITPSPQTTLADLVEALFPGYSRQPLPMAWTYPVILPDGSALSSDTPLSWTNSAGVPTPTIYTWFWYRPVSLEMVMVGRFDAPAAIPAHSTITHTPSYELTHL